MKTHKTEDILWLALGVLAEDEGNAYGKHRKGKGGYIYFVTDWQEYADFALEELTLTEGLKNQYADFAEPQSWRPKTKFERKGINADRVINELFFEKLQEKV